MVDTTEALDLRSSTRLSGIMVESQSYRTLGQGLSDRIFILGHGSGIPINDPYQVVSVTEFISVSEADQASPMFRGVMESYNGGCRDIFAVNIAPIVEYVDLQADRLEISSAIANKTVAQMLVIDPDYTYPSRFTEGAWNALTFYERLYERLADAYSFLLDWDMAQWILPVSAPFYYTGGVDFATQLADFCSERFINTGNLCMGILGTKTQDGAITADDVTALLEDDRLENLGEGGKFISVFIGETIFNFRYTTTSYSCSPVAVIAGVLSVFPVKVGITNRKIPHAVSLVGSEMSTANKTALARAGYNVLQRTNLARRGRLFEVVPTSDNTLAAIGSDFWSMTQMRLIMLLVDELRAIGRNYVGTIGFGQMKMEMQKYMLSLSANTMIRDFALNIVLSDDRRTAYVDVAVIPYFGIRTINFITEVGPDI